MNELKVGAAKVCISPPADLFPFPGPPYLGEGIEIDGILMDMYVRMIAIDNGEKTLLFGCFEESNGTDALKDAITEKYGIPYENQMYCQTHNHGGIQVELVTKPGTAAKEHMSYTEDQKRMGRMIFDKAIEAAGLALENRQPACCGFGEGTSYLNVNRDLPNEDGYWTQAPNYDGYSDKTLAVLKFTDKKGNLLAAMLNYACHANATIGAVDVDGKIKISADFPGFTCDTLEKQNPGATVLWTVGCAGDQNVIPCFDGEAHYAEVCTVAPTDSLSPGFQYRYTQNIGERHAADADRVLKRIDCHRDTLDLRSAVTNVQIPQQRAPEHVNFWLNIALSQNNVNVVKSIAPEMVQDGKILNRHIDDYIPTGAYGECEMQLFMLGDLAIVTVAAELYNKIGQFIKAACPVRNVFVITVTGGHGNRVGYIQDTESNTHKTFQHFGEAYPCDSNTIFADGVKNLVDQIFC